VSAAGPDDSDDASPLPSPPSANSTSTESTHPAGRPSIFPPSPSTAAALAATANLPAAMSSSIAQRMAGVITRSRSPSADKLPALAEPSNSSALNLVETNGDFAAHQPTRRSVDR
jgi:hypothetical protein